MTKRFVYILGAYISLFLYLDLLAEEVVVTLRKPPSLHGRIEGSLRIMEGRNLSMNSESSVTGDLYCPGTPKVKLNSNGVYLGTIEGNGSVNPSNYKITINSSASMGYVFNRTDSEPFPTVSTPPNPSGRKSVHVDDINSDFGDFTTIRNLTLNDNSGSLYVPAGTYSNFTANNGSVFRLGTANATEAEIYNFQRLNLNSGASLEIAGPVVITLKNGSSFNSSEIGNPDHPEWLVLKVAKGGINLNSQTTLYGHLLIPEGNVGLNSSSLLIGTLTAKRLNLNSNSVIVGVPFISGPPDNEAPLAIADSLSVDEDHSIPITLRGSDPEKMPLTFLVTQHPELGMLIGSPPNLTYTPYSNVNGSDRFTFIVNDGEQDSSPAEVSIEVHPINDPPVANSLALSTPEDTDLQLTLTGTDIENDALTFQFTATPSHGLLSGTIPHLTYSPEENYTGEDRFFYSANDGFLDSSPVEVSLNVLPINDAPGAVSLVYTLDEDSSQRIVLEGEDLESDSLQFIVKTLPQNGILQVNEVVVSQVPATILATDSLVYFPEEDFNNSDAFIYEASDGELQSGEATVTLHINPVNDPPTLVTTHFSATEDTLFEDQLIANDVDGETLTFSLQSNGTIGNASISPDGSFSYLPQENAHGSDSITINILDEGGITPFTVHIELSPLNDPPLAEALSIQTDEDNPTGITLLGSDVDGDPLSFHITDHPAQGVLSGDNPVLNYTPNPDFSGQDSFSYQSSDGLLNSSIAEVSITVNPINDAPFGEALTFQLNEDESKEISFNPFDVDEDILSIEIISLPTSGLVRNLEGNLINLGDSITEPLVLHYNPNENIHGLDDFSYRVHDGTTYSQSYAVSLNILPVNDPPIASNLSCSTLEDNLVSLTLNGADVDGDTITFEILTQPSLGMLSGIAPNLTYSPNNNVFGSDSFTYQVSDGLLNSIQASVSISILPVNDPPVVVFPNGGYSTNEDIPLNGSLILSDIDSGSLFLEVTNDPILGSLQLNQDGSFVYTPFENVNGSDSFEVTVDDGLAEIAKTIPLNIQAVQDPPVIGSNYFTLSEDSSLSGQTFVVEEVDGDSLSFTLKSNPTKGSVTLSGNTFNYTPNPNLNGADSFQVEVSDSYTPPVTFTIVLDIEAVPDTPEAFDQNLSLDENSSLAITLTGNDPDGETLSFNITANPTHGNVSGTGPNILYSPTPEFVGSDAFEFTVTAGNRISQPATINLDIISTNEAPEITSVPETHLYFQIEQPSVGPENQLLEAEVTIRDFSDTHPDFQNFYSDLTTDLVDTVLDSDGKPVFIGTSNEGAINSQETFSQWYRDVDGVNLTTTKKLILEETFPGSGIFHYENLDFFLIDDELLGNEGRNHNFHYTMEWHGLFTYRGGETFEFLGDDDIWLFIDGNLVVDIGGVHTERPGSVNLDTLGLTIGEVYPFDLFYAERFTDSSHLTFETSIEIKSDGVYTYQVIADDPDGDDLSFSLIEGPAGMDIDESGLITWLADIEDIGIYPVEVAVTDTANAQDVQNFSVVVERNFSPTVNTGGDIQVRSTSEVIPLDGQVQDDGNPGDFSLTHSWMMESGPSQASIAEPAEQSTTAMATNPGLYVFSLEGDDGELKASQQKEVYLQPDFSSPAPPGLIAWWSGNNNALDKAGGFHALFALERNYENAIVGSGFDFSNSRGYLQMDVTDDLDLTSHTGFSFEFWIRPHISPTDFGYVAQFGDPLDSGISIFYERSLSTQLSLGLPLATGGIVWADAFPFFEFGSEDWVHAVITYDSLTGQVVFYKNGIQVKKVQVGNLLLTPQDTLYIPQFRPKENQGFEGSLDEFSIYSRALEHQEVLDLFRNDIFGKPPLEGNEPPVIEPLQDQHFSTVPVPQIFSATITDDNLPYNVPPEISWEVHSQGSSPVLSTTTGSSTEVTFIEEGAYTFVVTATDGAFTTRETFNVLITAPEDTTYLNDLVAWWDANATTTDRIHGLVALPLAEETYTDGQVGAAISLDGQDDRFQVTATNVLNVGAGDGFSVEFWFKNDGSEKGRLLEWWKDEIQGVTLDKNAPWTNGLLLEVWDHGGNKFGYAEAGFFTNSDWEHIGITYDKTSGILRFFLNGAMAKEWTQVFIDPRTTGDFYIGGRPIFYPPESANGDLDELSLYSRALTPADIQRIFQAGSSGKVAQPFNQAPLVDAGEDQTVAINVGTTLNGSASDDGLPEGGVLTYFWQQTLGPDSSDILDASALSTTVSFVAEGIYEFQLTVSDSELEATDTVIITVTAPVNQAPLVNAGEDVTTYVEDTLFLHSNVSDDGLPTGSLTHFWSVEAGAPGTVSFTAKGNDFEATFSETGTYTLTLTANDGSLVSSDSKEVTVLPGTGLAILSLSDGDEITSPTDVAVRVQTPQLISYALQYRSLLDPGNLAWVNLTTGTETVDDAVIATFDPTLLLNGPYELKLSIQTTAGPRESDTLSLFVDGSMKVGNFSLAFKDMTIPGMGIPIEIVRSYDSRDKRIGDFGVGWQLAIRNLYLFKNRDLNSNWQQTLPSGDPTLQSFYVNPVKEKFVTIRLPDDSLLRFRLGVVVKNRIGDPDNCSFGVPVTPSLGTFEARYYPVGDTQGSLVSVGLGDQPDNQVYVQGTGTTELTYDFVGFEPYNPTRFKYTTNEGTEFIIDIAEGLASISDRSGHTLSITPGGLIHSSGRSITFTRNAEGLIETITDPQGNALNYDYDALDRLIGFTDRENNFTEYFYEDPNFPYNLTRVLDPRGIQGIRTEFDAEGRMVKQLDADGNEIVLTHDITNFIETVQDRLGHVTTYEYDDNGNVVRTIDPQLHETIYTYDDNNNELTVTDHLGNTTTRTYDSRNNLLTEEDGLGNLNTFTYDAFSNPLTIINARLKTTTFTYDTEGNLSTQLDAENNLTTYSYDGNGNLTSITDPLNQVTEFTYDSLGNQRRITIKDDQDTILRDTTYTYDSNGNQLSMTQARTTPNGPIFDVTTFEYDAENRLVKTIFPDASFTRTEYNSFGKQSSTFDELGRETSYEYDDRGNLTKTTFPDLSYEASSYDLEGRRSSSTDRRGFTTFFFYDELGRLTDTVYPDGTPADPNDNPVTSSVYDEIGRITTSIDELGNLTQFEYDPNCGCAGRRSKVIDALLNETIYNYDDNGNQEMVTDALLRTTTFTYDDNDRPIQTLFDDSSFTTTEYDALGRRVSEMDQAGNKTAFFYDALGRLIRVDKLESDGTAPPNFQLLTSTSYSYDESGNLISQIDAEGRETKYEYDSRGRRLKRTLPGGESEAMSYHPTGTLATKTDMNGYTTTYSYDDMNRLVEIVADPTHPSLALPHAPARITYEYNNAGQPTLGVVYNAPAHGETILHAMSMIYDEQGRLIEKAADGGILTYTYDATGNLKSSKSSNPEGLDVAFDYDLLNRLSSVGDQAFTPPETHGYTYDEVGNLETVSYANGVTHTYTYNTLNRLTQLAVTDTVSQVLQSHTYTLNSIGHRTKVEEASGRIVNYEYDNLYRLTQEVLGGTLPNPAGAIDYSYDKVGNRLTRTSTLAAVTNQLLGYDANDQLISDTYDDNGNTLTSIGGSEAVADTYDFMNRLIRRVSISGTTIDLIHDANGIRIRKSVTPTSSSTATTNYLVDENNHTGYVQVVEEQDDLFQVRKSYTYGHDLISVDQLSGGSWQLSYYLYDGHGNVRGLTDALGTLTDTYTYDAFGNLIDSTGSTPNSYLYTGEQYDFDLAMYFLRARYYNPDTGRFHTMDSFEGFHAEPLSLHKYLYTHANPVMGVDPNGNWTLAEMMFTVGVGGIVNVAATVIVTPNFFREKDPLEIGSELGIAFLSGGATSLIGGAIGGKLALRLFPSLKSLLLKGAVSGGGGGFTSQLAIEVFGVVFQGKPVEFKDSSGRILSATAVGFTFGGVLFKLEPLVKKVRNATISSPAGGRIPVPWLDITRTELSPTGTAGAIGETTLAPILEKWFQDFIIPESHE